MPGLESIPSPGDLDRWVLDSSGQGGRDGGEEGWGGVRRGGVGRGGEGWGGEGRLSPTYRYWLGLLAEPREANEQEFS